MSIITLTKHPQHPVDAERSKTDAGALDELRNCFVAMLEIGNEIGVAVHPAMVDKVWRMAEILGVDTDLIPTERKLFLRA